MPVLFVLKFDAFAYLCYIAQRVNNRPHNTNTIKHDFPNVRNAPPSNKSPWHPPHLLVFTPRIQADKSKYINLGSHLLFHPPRQILWKRDAKGNTSPRALCARLFPPRGFLVPLKTRPRSGFCVRGLKCNVLNG